MRPMYGFGFAAQSAMSRTLSFCFYEVEALYCAGPPAVQACAGG